MQDKFRLDLTDEEAVQYLQSLIDESVSAMFAVVVEQFHRMAQVTIAVYLTSVSAMFAVVVEHFHRMVHATIESS